MLKRVCLCGTYNNVLGFLSLCIFKLNGRTNCNGDFAFFVSLNNLGNRGNLADLVNARLVVGLLFFRRIIFGVLGKVTETASLFDTLNDLVMLLTLTICKLINKLLTTFRGKYDFFSGIHQFLSVDGERA